MVKASSGRSPCFYWNPRVSVVIPALLVIASLLRDHETDRPCRHVCPGDDLHRLGRRTSVDLHRFGAAKKQFTVGAGLKHRRLGETVATDVGTTAGADEDFPVQQDDLPDVAA